MSLILLLFFFSSYTIHSEVYYISPSGKDETGDGSDSLPWKTLYKACSEVTTAGDTIYIMAGLYDEVTTSKLAPGVSLLGEGITSVITSTTLTAEWTPIVDMRSSTFIDGNQTISYLKFDGSSLTAAQALWIAKRNNVTIHHCTFIDFKYTGIQWVGDGGYSGGDPYDNPVYPTNYVTGSVFYDNTVTNCARNVPYDWGRGALYIGGHDGMLIYNNTIVQTQRDPGYNGYPIKAFANGGFMRGWKVYNNTLTKVDPGSGSWMFAIEGAFYEGCEFYNNIITGAIDINFMDKGSYEYGVYIHDNILGPEAPSETYYKAVILEFGVEDVIIERNHIRNCAVGIHHTMRYPEPWVKRVKVRYNKFTNLGADNTYHYHSALRFGETSYDFDIEDYEIYNNIFHGSPTRTPYFGLHIRGFNTAKNIKVQNNIFVNFSYTWFDSNRGDYITDLYVQNNIFYNNASSNTAKITGTPVNYVDEGNKIVNPDLYSETNFHPNTDSPVMDAGVFVTSGLKDFDGIEVDDTPNIGCYETTADLAVPKLIESSVENSNPDLIIAEFDLPLANVVPSASAFEIYKNQTKQEIYSIIISGNLLNILLTEPVNYGDHLTLTYTIPSNNPLQSVNSVLAGEINNSNIINNVKNITTDESPLNLEIYPNPASGTFSIILDGEIPDIPSYLRIYDLNGSLVYEILYESGMLENIIYINVGLNPGFYVTVLSSNKSILGINKLIII